MSNAVSTTPDTGNYVVGKGKVSFKRSGESEFRDLGNVSEMEFTANLETLAHYSSRAGVKSKDKEIVLEKGGTLRLVMDEWQPENLALALLGTVEELTSPAGAYSIDIFGSNAVSGELKFEATNEVGPKWDFHFLRVDFKPGKSFSPLSDEWATLEISGEVVAVDGDFGTATFTPSV